MDVRVLAATSQDIRTHLREELYYRLSVIQITVPPLREHKIDIPPITDVMLVNSNVKHGTRISGVDSGVRDLLDRYDWPGNVRELRNSLERASIMAGEGLVRISDFPSVFSSPYVGGPSGMAVLPGRESALMLPAGKTLGEIEDAYIKLTLAHLRGNRRLAAKMLGIGLRTLQKRIKEAAAE